MTAQILLCAGTERKAVEYAEALRLAGLPAERVTVVTPTTDGNGLRELAAGARGLLLAGGADIHPRHYGEQPLAEANLEINEPLDALELELLAGAETGRTPVWAICRGMQTVNVHLGGTLFQDLQLQQPGVESHAFEGPLDHLAHGLGRVSADSRFGELLTRHASGVNSRHHQAVKALAPGLCPVAWSPDGVLEAFEHTADGWWLRGVQWHPENLTALPFQLELWRDFVVEATR
jgi:putative glutamine amidotransferase